MIKLIPASPEAVRKDFPFLGQKLNGKPPVYFDNACMSLRPQSVIDAVEEYYVEYPGCNGRSGHKVAKMVDQKVSAARETVAKFIHAKKKEEIVFTRNTTEGLNLVAHSLGLKKGDVVLTTDREHNSNLIPWQILGKKEGIVHTIVKSNADNTFNLDTYKALLKKGVRLVSMVHSSNLDGVGIPAKEIIRVAHEAGALVMLDAAQSVPHMPIDVQDLGVDFLAFSGHKALGPTGTGVLYGKYDLLEKLEPFIVGGGTVEYTTYETHKFLPAPDKFEAGLQDYANIIGMAEGLKYIEKVSFKKIQAHELELNQFVTDELLKMPRVRIIGPKDPAQRGGVVSFYADGADAHKIALMLDETANIMVRAGRFCVHSWFHAHNFQAAVRASIYIYNTMDEARLFTETLKKVLAIL